MMYDYPIFPDETKIAIEFLTQHPYVTQYGPIKVAGDLKGFVAPARWIYVMSTGGGIENPVRVSAPRVDINVYAESRYVAKRIAQAACAALLSMKNHVTDDAVVTFVETSTPADLTDPINASPRFVADATIHIRPK